MIRFEEELARPRPDTTTRMPLDKTADPPHAWAVIQDFVKQLMTVAGLMLTFSVPFYKEVLGPNPWWLLRIALAIFWLTLGLSILFSLNALGLISGHLRGRGGLEDCKVVYRRCNYAWKIFLTAMWVFVALAITRLFTMENATSNDALLNIAKQYASDSTGIQKDDLWTAWVGERKETNTTRYRFAWEKEKQWHYLDVILDTSTQKPVAFYDERLANLLPSERP